MAADMRGATCAGTKASKVPTEVRSLFITSSVLLGLTLSCYVQDGGGMLTSSIRRAHGVRTKVGRLRKHSVVKSDWFSVILTCKRTSIKLECL